MSVVGIDLGTTNTVVSAVIDGRVQIFADENGQRLLPSIVSFHPSGDVLVGVAAKERRWLDPRNTVSSHKRLLGRAWNSKEIETARKTAAYELHEGPGQGALIHARGKDYTLPEVSAFVLRRAHQIAERNLGSPVTQVVITVPAHFNELQRASTKIAGRVSGVEVLRILNEPTAAALAYGLGEARGQRICVYDFGGGTFDCTLLDVHDNVFEVLATAGDTFLGGDDIDTAIASRMADTLLAAHRYDARADRMTFERLKAAAEEVKMALSAQESVRLSVRDIAVGQGGKSLDLEFRLTRPELEQMIVPLVDQSLKVTEESLALAHLNSSAFDKVILVGGTTRIPYVRKRLEAFFGRQALARLSPEEVVAMGAAISGATLTQGGKRRIPPAPRVRGPLPSGVPVSSDEVTEPNCQPQTRGWGPTSDVGSHAPDTPFGMIDDSLVPSLINSSQRSDEEQTVDPSKFGVISGITEPTSEVTNTVVMTAPAKATTQPMQRQPAPANVAPGPTQASRHPGMTAPLGAMPPPAPVLDPTRTTSPLGMRLQPPSGGRISAVPPPPAAPTAMGLEPPHARYNSSAPPGRPMYPAGVVPQGTVNAQRQHSVPPGPRTFSIPPHMSAGAPPPILVDVTPLALVVETAGGFTDTVIGRNAKVPCERTRNFSTARDGQTVVHVRVGQGEFPQFAKNTYLGEVELSGIRAAARGEVMLEVTFEVDQDGRLRVRARDTSTGLSANAVLQLTMGLVDDQSIEAMINRSAATTVRGSS